MKIIKRLFCKHKIWDIQPTYTLLFYDRCKECGKLRKTTGEVAGTSFKIKFKVK